MASNVVYFFECPNCKIGYIGCTKRHLYTRATEHMGVSARTGKKLSTPPFSAIRDHVFQNNSQSNLSRGSECSVSVGDFRVLARAKYDSDLPLVEGILISEKMPGLNRKAEGIHIFWLHPWKPRRTFKSPAQCQSPVPLPADNRSLNVNTAFPEFGFNFNSYYALWHYYSC